MIAGKRVGVKVRITHSHNTKSEEFPSAIKKIYFAISKLVINGYSTSYFACGQEAGNSLFYSGRFTIIDNGINVKDFKFRRTTRDKLRAELKIPKDFNIVLHVGRFDEQKNHSFLIDVYAEYHKVNPRSKLVLVGAGALKEYIEQKVHDLSIQDDVMFLGKRSDVNRLYSAADIFLFPSLHEGLPVTLVEAQANGLICLVSDVIDKSTKLTECVHFYSLSQSPARWAQCLKELDLRRIDTGKVMEGSKYNMPVNIRNIEALYNIN
jgi:glycosyltransferase involved in cell wall biosynthesis